MKTEFSLAAWAARAEQALDQHLPKAEAEPRRLHQAMRYAALGGGKRLRATLVYATGHVLGDAPERLDALAAAIEMIHAYSLVHDDLPAMDNDDLRRGRPTVHRAFDEATAILVGDALLTEAFAVACRSALPTERLVEIVGTLARASGSIGMCGGQAIDIAAVGQTLSLMALEDMHRRKTGALIRAAVRIAAIAGNADGAELAALDDYANALGLAFQIKDDLLDVESDSATLGKTAGKDDAANKPTYVALLGLEGARSKLRLQGEAIDQALQRLQRDSSALHAIGQWVAVRQH
ncbi:polyprenyl synthetase family protein [Pseudomarimonas arenosa]|uniref:Polyprenyl synthetase family protein n=1 Tax=Pseudomarimonas arenosa TaxID=2774145 RepID=A0AAW3ZRX7_9GAMM|nr:farnesyl diphosphate synthase [Pseudomarimonas arenosa]MBD8527001.1 polyprenyl synthetase family protein [Pseudomarimonas arenosa]